MVLQVDRSRPCRLGPLRQLQRCQRGTTEKVGLTLGHVHIGPIISVTALCNRSECILLLLSPPGVVYRVSLTPKQPLDRLEPVFVAVHSRD
jgi:hypothetical protein